MRNCITNLLQSLWKGIKGMSVDNLTKWGTFVSKVGVPTFIIVFTMYYMVPIVDKLVASHLEFLGQASKTLAETHRENLENKALLIQSQEAQRNAEERKEEWQHTLIDTLRAMEERLARDRVSANANHENTP